MLRVRRTAPLARLPWIVGSTTVSAVQSMPVRRPQCVWLAQRRCLPSSAGSAADLGEVLGQKVVIFQLALDRFHDFDRGRIGVLSSKTNRRSPYARAQIAVRSEIVVLANER